MNVSRISAVAVAGIWILLNAGMAAARQAPVASRILVMPFAAAVDAPSPEKTGLALWIGHAVSLLLIDELGAQGLPAISREECARAFDRLQLPMASTLTRATMIRVGELLGASEIVFGDVRVGDRLNLRARVVRLEQGALLPEVIGDGTADEIFAVAHNVGGSIATSLGRRGTDALAVPHPTLEVFENYVKGLVAGTPATQQKFFETALRLAPRDPRVLVALWSVYTAQNAHEKALGVASAVTRESNLSRRARFLKVLSLISLGRLDGAYQELNALYSESPAAALSNALGVVQMRRGSASGGSAPAVYFTRAAQEDPGNTDYLFNLGYASALAGDSSAALLWLREAVRYDSADGEAHLVMSSVLAGSGRSVEAQRELELARLLGVHGPSVPAVVTDKIPQDLIRLRTDLDPSLTDRLIANTGEPAQRDQQDAARFQFEQGKRLFDAQNDREATTALRRSVYLAPYQDEPHLLLGRIYQRGGRLSEAIDEFKVAIWCRDTADARVALGEALLESGDKDGARREAERALALDRESAAAKALLKKVSGVVPSGRTHGRSGPA